MVNDGGRCCGCESQRLSRFSALTDTLRAGSRRVAKSRCRALCGDEMRGKEGIVAAFEKKGEVSESLQEEQILKVRSRGPRGTL